MEQRIGENPGKGNGREIRPRDRVSSDLTKVQGREWEATGWDRVPGEEVRWMVVEKWRRYFDLFSMTWKTRT